MVRNSGIGRWEYKNTPLGCWKPSKGFPISAPQSQTVRNTTLGHEDRYGFFFCSETRFFLHCLSEDYLEIEHPSYFIAILYIVNILKNKKVEVTRHELWGAMFVELDQWVHSSTSLLHCCVSLGKSHSQLNLKQQWYLIIKVLWTL